MAKVILVPNLGNVSFPDEMSADDINKSISKSMANMEAKKFGEQYGYGNVSTYNPQEDFAKSSMLNQYLVGGGKAMVDTGRGVGNLARETMNLVTPQQKTLSDLIVPQEQKNSVADYLGLPTRKDIATSRTNDAYINKSTPANIGKILADIGMFVGGSEVLPIANTLLKAGVSGTGYGLIQPVTENESRTQNAALGGLLNTGITGAGNMIGKYVAKSKAASDLAKLNPTTRDITSKELFDAGYVAPPSSIEGSGKLSKLAETIGGTSNTEKLAQLKNQKVTNKLANEYLGLPEKTSLSQSVIQTAKEPHNAIYEEVSNLPKIEKTILTPKYDSMGIKIGETPETVVVARAGDKLLSDLKEARTTANLAWKNMHSLSPSPSANKVYLAATQRANNLENELEKLTLEHNKTLLHHNFQTARKELAKINTVSNAMNDVTGDVNAKYFAKLGENNPNLLTGSGKTISNFGNTYGHIANVPKRFIENSVASPSDLIGYGAGGAAASLFGLPALTLTAAVRPILRHAVLRQAAQKSMLNPNEIGMVPNVLDSLLNNPTTSQMLKASIPTLLGNK